MAEFENQSNQSTFTNKLSYDELIEVTVNLVNSLIGCRKVPTLERTLTAVRCGLPLERRTSALLRSFRGVSQQE